VSFVSIPTEGISDWESFHDQFARVLGFPAYYGRNMDAWIDCLTYSDDATAGMIARELIADPGEVLTIQLENVLAFADRCPAEYAAIIECAAFVNWRRIEMGKRPILALSFWKQGYAASAMARALASACATGSERSGRCYEGCGS
jgi:hypothetical protein